MPEWAGVGRIFSLTWESNRAARPRLGAGAQTETLPARGDLSYPVATMAQTVEQEFMGGSKARVWTYLILAGLLLVILLVANFAWENPEDARSALDGFLGLPGWALAGIVAVVGGLVFLGGLKIEADWPEAVGALLIAGAVLAGEIMIGIDTFKVAGVGFMPYFIPLAIFGVLFGVGLLKSK